MNGRAGDHFDDAIDRAARALVEHDPTVRMHAAVMSEIRVTSTVARGSWARWPRAIVPALAAAVLVVTLWGRVRQDTPHAERPPESIVEHHDTPGGDEIPVPAAVPSRAGRRRMERTAPSADATQSALVPPIEVAGIRVDSVRIATIPLADVPIRPIRIEEITVNER